MVPEPIPFLANIVLVAHADGILSATELGQLEAIRQELKITKRDYNAALKMVEAGQYQITPVGSFADQVKNLELILRVAYADDDLSANETAILRVFCKSIGVTQEQVKRLCKEVLSSLKQQAKVCPKCGADNGRGAAFCSKCGSSLGEKAEDIRVAMEIPRTGIAIEFPDSTAAAFPKALEIAKSTPGYQSALKGKKTWHLAVFPSGNLLEALPLADCLSGMRNRVVYINGEEKPWDEVLGFAWCASERSASYRPNEYCFGKDDNRLNPWGCKQARMDWTEWADWFCFGRWETSGLLGRKPVWRFDKERIRHELEGRLFRYRFCPHLATKLVEAALRHLPETVMPETDANWGYHDRYEQVPGAIKIVEKERESGYTYTREFWADGVRPKGLRGLGDVMMKAFKEVGAKDVEARSLLK
jgi:uncharacterized tellurite resistance protein B-like protein/ribosomal protein L40E